MNSFKLIQVNINYGCNKNCSYCYAKDLKEDFEKDMTLDDFKDLLRWFSKNNIKQFNITGGEPTIHPLVGEMLALANREDFKVTIFTNGLFLKEFLGSIDYAESFLINYNHPNTYTPYEYELLHKNLGFIKQKGKTITFAFNITPHIDSCDYIIEAARKYGVIRVNMDLVIPNSFKNNEYVSDFKEKKELIKLFLKKFKENNINVKITRPLPFCIFKDEIRENKGVMYPKCSVGDGIISINPDLSIFPCLSIFFRGPKITHFNDFESVMSFYRNAINDFKWKRYLYPQCESCIYLIRKKCQGSCLANKCSQFNILNKDEYKFFSQYTLLDAQTFINQLDKSTNLLNKVFAKPTKKIKVYLFNNKKDMLYYSGVYLYPDWVTGFVSRNIYYQYLNLNSLNNANRITHELAHIYINQHKKGNNPPLWLEEGFCEYLNSSQQINSKLVSVMKEKELIPFDKLFQRSEISLLKHDADPLDRNIAYMQSQSLVLYLINQFGMDKVKKLLLENYTDFRQYFKQITLHNFKDVEEEWLQSINNIVF